MLTGLSGNEEEVEELCNRMKQLEVKGKADNLNSVCCKFSRKLFRSVV